MLLLCVTSLVVSSVVYQLVLIRFNRLNFDLNLQFLLSLALPVYFLTVLTVLSLLTVHCSAHVECPVLVAGRVIDSSLESSSLFSILAGE
jgi:hypothetical protein